LRISRRDDFDRFPFAYLAAARMEVDARRMLVNTAHGSRYLVTESNTGPY
jgi:hypothetical protein